MTEGLDATDDERAQVIAIAAAIEAFHLGDLGRGLARLSEAQESLTDPAAIDRVGVQRGQILLFAEGVDPVLGAVLPALEREPANSDDVLIHAAGVALAMTAWAGRLSEAAAFGQRGARGLIADRDRVGLRGLAGDRDADLGPDPVGTA